MSALVHGTSIAVAILLAYLWLHTPLVSPYSLQVFVVSILGYLALKRLNQAKLWHVVPAAVSLEMPLVTFAFLLLIGSTGNIDSIFYPLTYIHLFFLVLACEVSVAVGTSMLIVLFHFALTTVPTWHDYSTLATTPLIMLFFLFAKFQYDEALRSSQQLKKDEEELSTILSQESNLVSFVNDFIQPKLEFLEQLSANAWENQAALQGQIRLLRQEVSRILEKLK